MKILFLACLGCALAHAQPEPTAVATLMQVAYAESVHDRAAEWHVLRRQAAGADIPVEVQARRYSSLLRVDVRGQTSRRWVLGIDESCERPAGVPASEGWSKRVCETVRADAEKFLRGELADPCHGHARHWGMRGPGIDHERAMRAHWTLAPCSAGLSNDFWR